MKHQSLRDHARLTLATRVIKACPVANHVGR
jgi:hypothetical protein